MPPRCLEHPSRSGVRGGHHGAVGIARGQVQLPNSIQALLCPARIHTRVLTTAFKQLLWKIKTAERRVGAGDSGSLFVIYIVWGALN